MKNDEENQGMQDQISAEMEARIISWVSGDASPAEAAELERLAAVNPAVAAFKARIEMVGSLASEGVSADKAPLRMSESRRAALLREIGAKAKAPLQEKSDDAAPSLVTLQRRQQRERRWMLAAAACVTVGLFLSMMVPSFQKVRSGEPENESKGSAPGEMMARLKATEEKEAASVAFDMPRDEREVVLAAPEAAPAPRYYGAERTVELDQAKSIANYPVRLPAVAGGDLAQPKVGDGTQTPGILEDAGPPTAVAGFKKEARISSEEEREGAVVADKAEVERQAPVVLSPFVVEDAEDKGSYRANSTLAGTRVRTDLKDASSSISVVSQQFLQDTSAGNSQNVVSFGVESAGKTVAADTIVPGLNSPSASNVDTLAVSIPWDGAAPATIFGTGSPAGVSLNGKPAGAGGAGGSFGEVNASKEPVSTFSLHVSDVSFRLAQAALARGEAPDPGQIRPEEFYNAFSYGDPSPGMSERIACHTEQSVDPVMQQRNFLRIAMKVPTTGREGKQPLRLTLLIDTSGSMEREDRSQALQAAMKTLVSLLGRGDEVTLVGFARSPRLLAEAVQGDKADALVDIIRRTPPDGGTNLEEAIKLASELAQRHFQAGAQNRVVLLTDGAANLGDADPAHLAGLVESLRQRDIAFDACGVGTGGINDSVLEAITRKGSGRYYVLDSPEAADAGFARQLAGAFRPAAENVKVQVRFNPSRVGNYRLIGFENHRLKQEDFRNDKVAAAALAGGEAAVALYEVEALPQGEGDLGEVYVRFRDTATGQMVERSWALPYDPLVPTFDKASPSMQLAGTAALLAEKLRGGARGAAINLGELAPVVNSIRNHYSHEAAVQELAAMYQQTRRIRGE
jgi:Mg-chelatase subunit ChlD